MFARIQGTGSYLPRRVVTNKDLEKLVNTTDEWIRQRVGIISRHYAEDETTLYMAARASEQAMAMAGIHAEDVDLILCATATADYIMPSAACMLQHELGVPGSPALDISAACSGFVYALDVAKQYVENGAARHVLIVGAERLSRVIDFSDRTTCVLFGDGAGAAVVGPDPHYGIQASVLHSDGKDTELLCLKNCINQPLFQQAYAANTLEMVGNKVFKVAVAKLSTLVGELLEAAGRTVADIDWLVPHQANLRILDATAKKLEMPLDNVVVTLDRHGNTSAASIPLALDEAVRSGRIKKGDTLLLEAFGSGFVWGGALLEY